jgi:rhodanese-related sulfurtransferase
MRKFPATLLILVLILPVAILVFFRVREPGRFRHNARKLALSSFSGKNRIIWKEGDTLSPNTMLVDLAEHGSFRYKPDVRIVNIPAGKLLDHNNQRLLRAHRGPIWLYSADVAVAAKAWMILNQIGYRNVYILVEDLDETQPQYTFHPDSSTGMPNPEDE